MIYGNINSEYFAQQALSLPKPLSDALQYLAKTDLTSCAAGQTQLCLCGIDMMMSVQDVETKAREACRPEVHRKYIDLQFFVSGVGEKMTWYIDDGQGTVYEDHLNTPRDILLYENRPSADDENCVFMKPGAYAIFWPWDVHVPGQNPCRKPVPFRKVVVKVPFDACL